ALKTLFENGSTSYNNDNFTNEHLIPETSTKINKIPAVTETNLNNADSLCHNNDDIILTNQMCSYNNLDISNPSQGDNNLMTIGSSINTKSSAITFGQNFDFDNLPVILFKYKTKKLGNIEYERKIEDTNLNLYLTRIDKKLDVILDLLKHHTSSSNNYSSMTDTTFLNNFPVNDVETMQQLDEMFKKDQEYMTKLTNLIYSVGGSNAKNFIKRVLSKIFTNKLASKCSWTGQKNNFRLENLIIIQTMKRLCHELFKNDENTFEMLIKEWFRHGSQRLKRAVILGIFFERSGNKLRICLFVTSNVCSILQNWKNLLVCLSQTTTTIIHDQYPNLESIEKDKSTDEHVGIELLNKFNILPELEPQSKNPVTCSSHDNVIPVYVPNIKEKLQQWVLESNTSKNNVNKLLKILQSEGLDLPTDVRTLMNTPRSHA
ncbi:Uncharacterized protein FWK35_00030234, partial [Aphis craccivora]